MLTSLMSGFYACPTQAKLRRQSKNQISSKILSQPWGWGPGFMAQRQNTGLITALIQRVIEEWEVWE